MIFLGCYKCLSSSISASITLATQSEFAMMFFPVPLLLTQVCLLIYLVTLTVFPSFVMSKKPEWVSCNFTLVPQSFGVILYLPHFSTVCNAKLCNPFLEFSHSGPCHTYFNNFLTCVTSSFFHFRTFWILIQNIILLMITFAFFISVRFFFIQVSISFTSFFIILRA